MRCLWHVRERTSYFLLNHTTCCVLSSSRLETWQSTTKGISISRFSHFSVPEERYMALQTVTDEQEDTKLFKNRKLICVSMLLGARLEYREAQDTAILHPDQYDSYTVRTSPRFAFHIFSPKRKTSGLERWGLDPLRCRSIKNETNFVYTSWQKSMRPVLVRSLKQLTIPVGLMRRKYPPPTLFIQMDNCIRKNKNR